MNKTTQNVWISTYNRILRKAFHTVKGTNIKFIQQQLFTMDLDDRMKLRISQQFSRLIRTPQSGIMDEVIKNEYDNKITKYKI